MLTNVDANTLETAKQILQNIGLLTAAVTITVNALKQMGLPGRIMPVISILLGIGGAWLSVSHDPALFVIVGVIASAGETAIFSLNQSNFQKKYEQGQAPAQVTEAPVQQQPVPPAPAVEDTQLPPPTSDIPEGMLEPEPEDDRY